MQFALYISNVALQRAHFGYATLGAQMRQKLHLTEASIAQTK